MSIIASPALGFNTLQVLTDFLTHVLMTSPFYKWGNWGTERLHPFGEDHTFSSAIKLHVWWKLPSWMGGKKSYSSHVWLTPRRVWNYWIQPMFASSPAKLACPVYSVIVFNVENANLHSQAGSRFYLANQCILNASSFTSHGFHYVSGDKGLLLFHFSYSRVGALLWRLIDFLSAT